MVKLPRIWIPPLGWPKLPLLSSVRGRIIVGFGLLVLILVAVVAGSAWQMREHRSHTVAMEEHADTAFLLKDAHVNAEAAAAGLQRYVTLGGETLVAGDEELLPGIRSDVAAVEESLAQVIGQAETRGDEEEIARLSKVTAGGESLLAGVEMITALVQSGDVQAAVVALEVVVVPFREFEGNLEAAAKTELQAVSTHRTRVDRADDLALWLLIISGIGAAVLGLAASVVIGRSILKPLSSLEETAVAVSKGDLEARAQATGPRELASLGASLNQMTDSLLDASKRRELEAELRESEGKWRSLVENIPDIVMTVDRDGTILYINRAPAGSSVGDATGAIVYDHVPAEHHDALRRRLESVFETGEIQSYEIDAPGPFGRTSWYFNRIGPVMRGGRVVAATIIATDTSERKRTEEALAQSEEQVRLLMDSTAEAIYGLDLQGNCTLCNPACLRILGYDEPGDLLGKNMHDVIHHTRPDGKPYPVEECRIYQSFQQGEGVHVDDEVLWHADGTSFPAEYWSYPMKSGGEVVGSVVTFVDITERKQAEEELGQRTHDLGERVKELNCLYGIAQFVDEPNVSLEEAAQGTVDIIPPGWQYPEVTCARIILNGQEFSTDDFREVPRSQTANIMIKGERIGSVEVCYLEERPESDEGPFLKEERSLISAIAQRLGEAAERKRAEQILRESEERFRQLVNQAADAIFVTDLEGKFTDANIAACESLGYTRDELLSMSVVDIVDGYSPDTLADLYGRLSGGATVTVDGEHRRKDGTKLPVELRIGVFEVEGRQHVLALARDVTERKRADDALRESDGRYHDLFDNASDLIQSAAPDGSIVYVNPAWREALGYSEEETRSLNLFDIIHPDSKAHCMELFQRAMTGERLDRVEAIFQAKDGRSISVEGNAFVQFQNGKPVATRGIFRDITERKEAEEAVAHLAYHDALTDLPNRNLLRERLDRALAQACRDEQTLTVIFLDLDRFKLVNDTAGHAEGDRLLQSVADELRSLAREGDTVGRVGGDEFILLIQGIAGVEDAAAVAERILESFRRLRVLGGHEFHITASLGVTMYPGGGEDSETLLRNADIAMYQAKQAGRDNCQFYNPAMNTQIEERLVLESDLRHALERGEFTVNYQPQVDVNTRQVVGVEVLVRWQHPERGLVLPGEFIPVAEETGLIVPLGEWVLRTACTQNKAWQEAGFPPMRMAVNLSARQFQEPNLVDAVAQVLRESGLDPHYLQLEITEGTAIQDVDFTITMLRILREMGVEIAIDDFGTGYSSLAYLQRFAIDVIKLDRSFMRDIPIKTSDAAIATTVIMMAHNLKLSVIAEGVETEDQLAFLKEQGCDEMQGYLFSKPLPAEELEEMLAQGKRRQVVSSSLKSR